MTIELLPWIPIPPADFSYRSPWRYVYFMQAGISGAIKIGKTWNIAARINSIRVGNHEPVELVGWVKIDKSDRLERQLHLRFEKHHIRGEWYRPHGDVLNFINNPELGA